MLSGLVVDQSPIIRQILGVMLARLGFAMVEAETSEQALAACQESLPDVAMIDWTLPDDAGTALGIALVQHLRRLPGGEKVKVIMCTSERSVTQIETALAAGADEYVTKPFGIDVLQTKLGYLGFEPASEGSDQEALRQRRLISRVGFAGMTVAERDPAEIQAGAVIFQPGDPPDYAYILLSGQIAIGGETLQPYDLFGDLALIENTPRLQKAVAVTDCMLMRISRHSFNNELSAASPFLRNWIECASEPR